MSNNVYFGNSAADMVSINVNDALQNLILDPRSTTTKPDSGEVTVINCPAVQCPSGPNKDKGIFGTSGGVENKINIVFERLEAGNQIYTVETEGLSGRDLYIYVFDGSLEGQDETGRANGIIIKRIE